MNDNQATPADAARGPCRLAVVGCGRATAELHLPALRHVPDIAVVALCDADLARARTVAANFGVAATCDTVDALLERADVDAVAVCTPPAQHAAPARAVLDAGRHLFLEKPLATTRADCDGILAAAARSAGQAVAGFNLRHHRLLGEARRHIAAGAVGAIELVRGSFTTDVALRFPLPPWRRSVDTGGGVLFELAVHHFDLWHWLTGATFDEVFARGRAGASDDLTAAVTARATNGMLATAQFSERTHAANELEILGETAALRVSLYDFDGLRLVSAAAAPGGIGGRVRELARTARALPAGIAALRRGGDYRATFRGQWQAFADTVLRGAPPAATLEDADRATRMSIAAGESLRAGRPVPI